MKQKIKHAQLIFLTILVMSVGYPQQAEAYYQVGESLSQETLDKVVSYCANGGQDEALSQLLIPGDGQPTRVLLINFFASW